MGACCPWRVSCRCPRAARGARSGTEAMASVGTAWKTWQEGSAPCHGLSGLAPEGKVIRQSPALAIMPRQVTEVAPHRGLANVGERLR